MAITPAWTTKINGCRQSLQRPATTKIIAHGNHSSLKNKDHHVGITLPLTFTTRILLNIRIYLIEALTPSWTTDCKTCSTYVCQLTSLRNLYHPTKALTTLDNISQLTDAVRIVTLSSLWFQFFQLQNTPTFINRSFCLRQTPDTCTSVADPDPHGFASNWKVWSGSGSASNW